MSLIFIAETVGSPHREHFLVIAQTFYGVGHLGNAGFYYWLRDWRTVFIYCYIVPAAVLLVGLSLFLVDTPLSLVHYLSANKARKALFWVAKINRKQEFYISLGDIREIKEMEQIRVKEDQGTKFSFLDLFRYPSLRGVTIAAALLENSILFLFYAPTLMIAQF